MSGPDPYELVFATPRFEDEAFPAIDAEARARGLPVDDPHAFRLLASVGDLLRELPDAAEASDPGASADLGPFAALLFHAFQFHRFGSRRWVVEPEALERILDEDVGRRSWVLAPPHPAGYVALPRQRLWSRVSDDVPPEPAHGFFWSMAGSESPAGPSYARLDVLLCLGVRPGRPGLSVIETALRFDAEHDGRFADPESRPGQAPFANILPGGELSGLRGLVNAGEVLELVARTFRYLGAHAAAAREADDTARPIRAERLPERRDG